jgi:hypothetical protein
MHSIFLKLKRSIGCNSAFISVSAVVKNYFSVEEKCLAEKRVKNFGSDSLNRTGAYPPARIKCE